MFDLKKMGGVILLATSYTAFSGTMGPVCQSVDLKTPCASKGWGFGAEIYGGRL